MACNDAMNEINALRAALAEANTENVEYRAENADLKAALAEAQRELEQRTLAWALAADERDKANGERDEARALLRRGSSAPRRGTP